MTTPTTTDYSTLLKRAAEKIAGLQQRLGEAEARHKVPIAVVGMACRFPGGADSPDAYWRLLTDGVDAVTGLPAERRRPESPHLADPNAPHTTQGSYLPGVDGFDAAFFGITDAEATAMDPQQRLLLEVTWEALEHAGLPVEALRATTTGVFMGVTGSDYWQLRMRRPDLGPLDAATGIGSAGSFAVGRISHLLGLQGPCMCLDTGCSSAMVGVHLATRSLRSGESDTALVGAAHLMLGAEGTETLADLGVLSRQGKCKTFDAEADGFVVGEGCGVIVLKRLPDALRDGDRVLAVIKGSATNHNGASGALGIPNGSAQRAVIRGAYADAATPAASVGYVEAHGTGTPLGDAIELQALVDELVPGRDPDLPLVVGTGKTNIGHLETASGMAALIKAVLCLHHGAIPAHLHFSTPHPELARAAEQIVIPTESRPWPAPEGTPRTAGVSSFSANGTNVHVVLADAPTTNAAATGTPAAATTTATPATGAPAGTPAAVDPAADTLAAGAEAGTPAAGDPATGTPTSVNPKPSTPALGAEADIPTAGGPADTLRAGRPGATPTGAPKTDGAATRTPAAGAPTADGPAGGTQAGGVAAGAPAAGGPADTPTADDPAGTRETGTPTAVNPLTGTPTTGAVPAAEAPPLLPPHLLSPHLLPLSARSPEALRTLATRVAARLDEGVPLADVAWTTACRRSHLEHRLTVTAATAAEAARLLRAAAAGRSEPGALATGRHTGGRRPVVFSYGPPDAEALLSLLRPPAGTDPRAGAAIDVLNALNALEPTVATTTGTSLRALLAGSERLPADPEGLRLVGRALQLALTAWWRSAGITPATVIGVGEGRWAAAHAAGRIGTDQALAANSADPAAAGTDGSVLPLHLCDDAREAAALAARLAASKRHVHLELGAATPLPTALGQLHCQGVPVDWAGLHPLGARFAELPRYPWQHKSYWWGRTP
ncbi:beta-ketoacyl synthase N-terminal-like domain-containing protein [Streptomyces sp. NPDC059949]|uniref:beta-ketoacyl synthase N-terminal-like domain-containing protein n=1 Tax=Streptomyces sp. NPDC059949 TaxID=3347013 RepID=UPI0036633608